MIKHRNNGKKFILAKAVRNTLNSALKLNYIKNIELSLIASILITIFVFRISTKIDVQKYWLDKEEINFEFIDIPEIPPVIQEPPKMKAEQVVELPPEPEETVESDDLIEQVEELLNENSDEASLDIASNSNDNLITDSQLGLISRARLNVRGRNGLDGGNLGFGDRGEHNGLAESSLDIGQTSRTDSRFVSDNSSLDLGVESKPKKEIGKSEMRAEEPKLGLGGQPEKVLSFSSSTFGTDGYKLWNKIMSELDRLNKGRYGSVPEELKRNREGFLINFTYSDKTLHEIHWRNDGNVWIKVIGRSSRTTVQELSKALNGLLRLSL